MTAPATFYAHGKLMLSGEYFALDGAKTLAVPTRFGQRMWVHKEPGQGHLVWEALKHDGEPWLEAVMDLPQVNILSTTDEAAAISLQALLKFIQIRHPAIFKKEELLTIQTQLEFDQSWGLGSSSSIISLLGQWSGTDAIAMGREVFGGSGYDIACAQATGPVVYDVASFAKPVDLNWPFKNDIIFVHLGQKQNSREGIEHYYKQGDSVKALIPRVNELTQAMIAAQTTTNMMEVMHQHEQFIADALGLPKVKGQYFADFQGAVKSLGAWGGDFVMALANQPAEETKQYFVAKGYPTAFSWEQLIFAAS